MADKFYIGQKVVCVRADKTNHLNRPELVLGRVYTVRWEGIAGFTWQGQIIHPEAYCIRVEGVSREGLFPELDALILGVFPELANDIMFNDPPFNANRFKPLREGSTEASMEILRGLLIGKKIKEDA